MKVHFLLFCPFRCFCSSQKQVHSHIEFSVLGRTASLSSSELTNVGRRCRKAWLTLWFFRLWLLIPCFSEHPTYTVHISINLAVPWALPVSNFTSLSASSAVFWTSVWGLMATSLLLLKGSSVLIKDCCEKK